MKTNVAEILVGVNQDLVEILEEHIDSMVESHVEAWKDRYYPKSVEDISFDLYVNHDGSLEIEFVEEQLGRELEDKESEIVSAYFNESVLNEFR